MQIRKTLSDAKTCKLTRIDAKIGVLMIHQNTSVFSIISQHLVMTYRHETIFMYKQLQIKETNTRTPAGNSLGFFLPHIIVVGFSDAPSGDEYCRTSWRHETHSTHQRYHCTSTAKVTTFRLSSAESQWGVTLAGTAQAYEGVKERYSLTPADHNVSPEVLPLGEERDSQQCVKIEAFHQQPEEAGHDAVLEEHNHCFAANLANTEQKKKKTKQNTQ